MLCSLHLAVNIYGSNFSLRTFYANVLDLRGLGSTRACHSDSGWQLSENRWRDLTSKLSTELVSCFLLTRTVALRLRLRLAAK